MVKCTEIFVAVVIHWANCGLTSYASVTSVSIINTLLASFDKEVRPYWNSGTPVIVQPGFYINSISEINEISMDYKLNLFFRLRWNDPRLRFSAVNHTILIHPDRLARLWTPDVYIKNEKDGKFNTLMSTNTMLSISPNGDVFLSRRVSLKLSCLMDLYKFPLDNQTCFLEMESYSHSVSDLVLKWNDNAISWVPEKSIELPDFQFVGADTADCTQHYSTGTFSCLKANFYISRNLGYYLSQLYVPSILIVILSWVSFWLDVNATPARVSLGLLTVLTMTTQSARFPTPRVSYIKALDVWTSACLTFVFGALVEFAIVNVRAREDTVVHVKEKEEKTSRDAIVNHQIDSKVGTEEANPRRWKTKVEPLENKKKFQRRSKAHQVDVVSRILFPGLFLFFNVIYWVTFLEIHR